MSDLLTASRHTDGSPDGSGGSSRRGPWVIVATVLIPVLVVGTGVATLLLRSGDGGARPQAPAAPLTGGRSATGVKAPPAPASGDFSADPADIPLEGAEPADDIAPAAAQVSSVAKRVPRTFTTRDVTTMIARRSAALRTHNEKAFLATFDPAKPSLVATERTLFRNLNHLPLVKPVYKAFSIGGSSTVKRSYVSLLYQFKGVDAEATELSKVEQYIRRNGVVVTTAQGAVRGQTATRFYPLDSVSLKVVNGPLVTVTAMPGVDNVAEVAKTAEHAAADVKAIWGKRPGPTRFFLTVTRTHSDMSKFFGVIDDTGTDEIGLALPQAAFNHPRRIAGARVIVDLDRHKDNEALYRTMRHEFTHAIAARVQAVFGVGERELFPAWTLEGFAAWVEESDKNARDTMWVQALRYYKKYWNHQLPPATRAAFYSDPERGAFNYAAGSLIFRYAAKTYGNARTISFYIYLVAGKPKLAWKALGTTQAAFTKGWAGYVDGLLA
jgi:hypothetical protein